MRPEQDEFLEKLFRSSYNELELYANALLKNHSDAETAVQDAFHTACNKIDDIMNSPNSVGWMKNVIKNISKNMRRRNTKESMLVMRFAKTLKEVRFEESKVFELYEQCKAILTKEEYDLMVSIYINGVSPKEKAQELEISIWACYKRINRMLSKLRQELEIEEKKFF